MLVTTLKFTGRFKIYNVCRNSTLRITFEILTMVRNCFTNVTAPCTLGRIVRKAEFSILNQARARMATFFSISYLSIEFYPSAFHSLPSTSKEDNKNAGNAAFRYLQC